MARVVETASLRRAMAATAARRARISLRDAAKYLDDGAHTTGLQNAHSAIVACDDLVDAIDGHGEAEDRA